MPERSRYRVCRCTLEAVCSALPGGGGCSRAPFSPLGAGPRCSRCRHMAEPARPPRPGRRVPAAAGEGRAAAEGLQSSGVQGSPSLVSGKHFVSRLLNSAVSVDCVCAR